MTDEQWMKIALEEASLAYSSNEVPVGAIIVLDGQIIGRGHNQREAKLDISSHAEIEALKDAAKNIGSWNLKGSTLYVTVEPCMMCSGAILQAGISRVVYGTDDQTIGAVRSHIGAFDDPSFPNRPLVTRGVLEEECRTLMEEFFKNLRQK